MEVIHGILARLWCSCAVMIIIGAYCLLIAWIEKERKISTTAVACLCILLGLTMGIWYSHSLLNPDAQEFSGIFVYEQKKTDALPPLPLAREYVFESEQGERICLYMDSIAKKQLFPDTLEQGKIYTVTYEEHTDVILQIES